MVPGMSEGGSTSTLLANGYVVGGALRVAETGGPKTFVPEEVRMTPLSATEGSFIEALWLELLHSGGTGSDWRGLSRVNGGGEAEGTTDGNRSVEDSKPCETLVE